MVTSPHNRRRLYALGAAIVTALLVIGAEPSRGALVFSQDFESGLGPNETTGGAFQINNTHPTLNNGTFMMGHPTFYSSNEYSFYEVVLDLTNFEDVVLQFDFNANFETHFDRFNVQASTCPVNPPNDLVEPTSGMTYLTSHRHRFELGTRFFDTTFQKSGTATFDLSAFDLQPNVCVRLQFGSDSFGNRDGINVDDIQVSGAALCFAVIAVDDHFSVINDGTTAELHVLANEECPGDQPLTVVALPGDLVPDRGGSASTDGTTVAYTPAEGFVGFEEFTYTARDAGLDGGDDPPKVDRDRATVVVEVVEDLFPDAVDDVGETTQNRPSIIDVLANDTLGNGAHVLAIETTPAQGSATLLSDDTIRYAPNVGFFGADGFEYRLTDVNGDSDVATVAVGVFFVSGAVPIDIMPNDAGNNINLTAGPGAGFDVAILSVEEFFDAPNVVDPLTLKLGPRQANIWGSPRVRDIDGDGDEDLIVRFLTQQTGIACGDTHVILTGRTFESRVISGSDAINTFNCPRVRKRY